MEREVESLRLMQQELREQVEMLMAIAGREGDGDGERGALKKEQ